MNAIYSRNLSGYTMILIRYVRIAPRRGITTRLVGYYSNKCLDRVHEWVHI